MRKHRDLAWLLAIVVVIGCGAWWRARTAMRPVPTSTGTAVSVIEKLPDRRGATVLSRDKGFTLRVMGAGQLRFGQVCVDRAGVRVDPRDGDLVHQSFHAHLEPKVSLPSEIGNFEITPDGYVLAESPQGPRACGRIQIFIDGSPTNPGEHGAGKLIVQ